MKLGPRRNYQEGRGQNVLNVLNVLNVKALVAAFNQEKALVGAFSVIVKTDCETDGSSAALVQAPHRQHKDRMTSS